MATIQISKQDGWKKLSDVSCDYQNISAHGMWILAFDATSGEPVFTSAELGFYMPAWERTPVDLSDGKTLYGRNENNVLISASINEVV